MNFFKSSSTGDSSLMDKITSISSQYFSYITSISSQIFTFYLQYIQPIIKNIILYCYYFINNILQHSYTKNYILIPIYNYKYYILLTLSLLFIIYFIYKQTQYYLKNRKEFLQKEILRKKQRITTLYELIVNERQYVEFLELLFYDYYLPIEKGIDTYQQELDEKLLSSINNTTATATTNTVNKDVSSNKNVNNNIKKNKEEEEPKEVSEQEEQKEKQKKKRNIINFSKIHRDKKDKIFIPNELENIFLLNKEFLKSLECEILGMHQKDQFLTTIYRNSIYFISTIFSKLSNNLNNNLNGSDNNNLKDDKKNNRKVVVIDSNIKEIKEDNNKQLNNNKPTIPTLNLAMKESINNNNINNNDGGNNSTPSTPSSTVSTPNNNLNNNNIENFGYKLIQVRENCNILNCFKKYMYLFQMYGFYISKFNECRQSITNCNELKNLLKIGKSLKKSSNLDLISILVMIPQRLPRYIMFLKNLQKFTNLNDLQFKEIEFTIKEIEKITFKVNSFVKEVQMKNKLIQIRNECILKFPNLESFIKLNKFPEIILPYRKVINNFKLIVNYDEEITNMEIYITNDVIFLLISRNLKLKNENNNENTSYLGSLLSSRKKNNNLQNTLQQNTQEMNELYFGDLQNFLIYTINQNKTLQQKTTLQNNLQNNLQQNEFILELNQIKYLTKEMIENPKKINKIFHLKKEENSNNLKDLLEKLQQKNRNGANEIITENVNGIWSNSKLLTLLVPNTKMMSEVSLIDNDD
ncbi:hypothetical protein ABK040_003158 [Willaertia magna]